METPAIEPHPIRTASLARCVLVADATPRHAAALRRRLHSMGLNNVHLAPDSAAAAARIAAQPVDLLLLDIAMPGAFALLETLAQSGRIENTPVVITAASPDIKPIVRAIKLGAEGFLLKPCPTTLLRARVLATLEKKALRDRVREELARKQTELAEARRLQLALAPPPYADAALSLDVALEPAWEIGGDLVDHIRLDDGRHVLVLGDVSGKGAGAALMMARCHALMRGAAAPLLTAALPEGLARTAGLLNRELAANNASCMFITMLIAVFDPADGRLDYIRCGHVPPFLRRTNGAVERLNNARGLPLGIEETAIYTAATTHLHAGESLLILSDGITEATAPDDTLFADMRVVDWLAEPQTTLASLVAKVRAFEAGQPAADDVAALLVHRK
jgi:sigma-B regulation protein RsbU (phosphoserine phosphatase)